MTNSELFAVEGVVSHVRAPLLVVLAAAVASTASAQFQSFGSGCAGSLGVPTHTVPPVPAALPGSTVTYQISNVPPVSVLCFGTERYEPGLSLTPIGMTGCDLNVEWIVCPVLTVVGGAASYGITLSSSTSLIGCRLYTQLIALDPPANAAGFTTSAGGALRIESVPAEFVRLRPEVVGLTGSIPGSRVATLVGAVGTAFPRVPAISEVGYDFDPAAPSSHIEIANPALHFQLPVAGTAYQSESFTVCAFVRFDQPATPARGDETIASRASVTGGGSYEDGWVLYRNTDGRLAIRIGGALCNGGPSCRVDPAGAACGGANNGFCSTFRSLNPLATGSWQHVAFTIEGNGVLSCGGTIIKLFIDGHQVDGTLERVPAGVTSQMFFSEASYLSGPCENFRPRMRNTGNTLYLAALRRGGGFVDRLDGQIDEFRIYNSALTPAEVMAVSCDSRDPF